MEWKAENGVVTKWMKPGIWPNDPLRPHEIFQIITFFFSLWRFIWNFLAMHMIWFPMENTKMVQWLSCGNSIRETGFNFSVISGNSLDNPYGIIARGIEGRQIFL